MGTIESSESPEFVAYLQQHRAASHARTQAEVDEAAADHGTPAMRWAKHDRLAPSAH